MQSLKFFQLGKCWRTLQELSYYERRQSKENKEDFAVIRSRSLENPKFGHFTLLFCRVRHRNVPKCKTHMQSDCFCSLSPLFCGVLVAVAVPRFLNSLFSVSYSIRTWNKHPHIVPCLDATCTTEFSYHTCVQYNSLKPTEHHRTGCLVSRKKAYLMAMGIIEPLGGGRWVRICVTYKS